MAILAIDPGLSCGWVVRRNDAIIACGVWNLRGDKFEGAGMRWLRFRGYISQALDSFSVSQVAYEAVRRHMGTDAAHIYGAIVGVIQEECERREIPYCGLDVGTIKKHATGKGNANKVAMVAAANEKWPTLNVTDDNLADALWIADLDAFQLKGGQ